MATLSSALLLCICTLLLLKTKECYAEMCIEDELKAMKEKISGIESKLEQFNSLYLLQLESKLTQLFLKMDRVEATAKALHAKTPTSDVLGAVVDRLQLLERKFEVPFSNNEVLDRISNIERSISSVHDLLRDQVVKRSAASTICSRLPCAPSNTQQSFSTPNPHPVEEVFMDLLETAVSSDEGSDIPAPRSLHGDQVNISAEAGLRDGKRNAMMLFGRLWRRMMRPSMVLDRKVTSLLEISQKSFDVCEKSLVIQNRMAETRCTGSSDAVPHVDRLATLIGDRVTRLEQRLLHHGHETEKVLDRVVAKCVPSGNKGTSGNSGTAALDPDEDQTPAPTPDTSIDAKDCAQMQNLSGVSVSGVYHVTLPGFNRKTEVYCDLTTDGGGWTVIQRRGYFPGFELENFNRNWAAYRKGFGNVSREFWLGNHPIHSLTTDPPMQLRVEIEDFEGNRAYAVYSTFRVDSEDERFRLNVGGYSGNASDSLGSHNEKYFSAQDRINDEVDPCCSCAIIYEGGWWFYACFESHLNGRYLHVPVDDQYFQGIIWEYWKGDYSLKAAEMKIRPVDFVSSHSPPNHDDNDDNDDYAEDP